MNSPSVLVFYICNPLKAFTVHIISLFFSAPHSHPEGHPVCWTPVGHWLLLQGKGTMPKLTLMWINAIILWKFITYKSLWSWLMVVMNLLEYFLVDCVRSDMWCIPWEKWHERLVYQDRNESHLCQNHQNLHFDAQVSLRQEQLESLLAAASALGVVGLLQGAPNKGLAKILMTMMMIKMLLVMVIMMIMMMMLPRLLGWLDCCKELLIKVWQFLLMRMIIIILVFIQTSRRRNHPTILFKPPSPDQLKWKCWETSPWQVTMMI